MWMHWGLCREGCEQKPPPQSTEANGLSTGPGVGAALIPAGMQGWWWGGGQGAVFWCMVSAALCEQLLPQRVQRRRIVGQWCWCSGAAPKVQMKGHSACCPGLVQASHSTQPNPQHSPSQGPRGTHPAPSLAALSSFHLGPRQAPYRVSLPAWQAAAPPPCLLQPLLL